MKTIQSGSKQFMFMMTTLFVLLLTIMATGCSGGDSGSSSSSSSSSSSPDTTVEAPGVPTNFIVAASAAGGDLSATLSWSAPTTGGEPTSYEIYRITTEIDASDVIVFDPANHMISIPAVEAQSTYEFIDNAGLERGKTTHWVVAAKNAGGETPTLPGVYTPPGSGGGEVDTYGNNFAAAMVFADGYGISNQQITGSWTKFLADIDYNTGLRPSSEQNLSGVTLIPYLDPTTTYVLDGVTYYKQKTASTWQGQWINGSTSPAEHNVTAKWGDNLISQTLNTESIVRIEMVLTKALDTNMTAYNMVSLYGTQDVEIYGTDGKEYNTTTAFVFTKYARLTIQQVDASGNPIGDPVDDQVLFDPLVEDGPGKFGAEINVAGNLTYGYVWDLKNSPEPFPAGTYRITFTLEDPSNVVIGDVSVPDEGDGSSDPVLASDKVVYIDITIHE